MNNCDEEIKGFNDTNKNNKENIYDKENNNNKDDKITIIPDDIVNNSSLKINGFIEPIGNNKNNSNNNNNNSTSKIIYNLDDENDGQNNFSIVR